MKPSSLACAVALLLAGTHVRAGDDARLLLEAEFNDEPIDQPIGTGGALLGQPVSVSPELSAIVRAVPRPTPSLEISQAVAGIARSARFEFLDAEEVSHGDLVIRLTVRAAQLDYFNVNVREPTSSTQNFLRLAFTAQGSIAVNDNNGFAGNLAAYGVNVDHRLRIAFQMDRGTYDIELDGVPILGRYR